MTELVALLAAGGTLASAYVAHRRLHAPPKPSSAKHIKPSKLRYKAMLAEVQEKVDAAMLRGDYTNPYPEDDKRHERFARNLNHRRITAALFDM